MKVKRITALLVALVCLFGCFGCSGETTPAENQTTTEPVETGTPATTEPVETSTPVTTEPAVSEAAMEKLDGKKVLIVGNSLCFYGHAVLRDGTDVLTQEQRNHDKGYFYQLCKSQGAEVSVTDWAYGDHSLFETLGNSCTRSTCLGVDHLSYLTDRYYDYVVFTPYEKDHDVNMQEYLQPMMDIFLAVNPNVQFILAVPHMAYTHNFAWAARLPEIDCSKLTVCNWGKMVTDIMDGRVQVPNAKQQYIKNSFVVSVSEQDGFHQNVLSGYITALMLYCAITGDSAVGLPYDFCSDTSIDTRFNFAVYKKEKYIYDPFTNFIEIFESPADMDGLQQLVDRYIAEPFPG